MVARITTGKSIRAMLLYNENKVTDKEATLIMASGFAGDVDQMTSAQKLKRFSHLLDLKPSVKTNAVHISLNFHSSEQLDQSKLQQIGASYIEKIGFGDQPFLIYQHYDSAHTHMHIVTTNITRNAERIDLHDIGKLLSEPARKAIEKEFELVKAEKKDFEFHPVIKKVDIEKVRYGHLPTKRALSNVLTAVNRDYCFTSLAEYNAALKCFNVVALRGNEDSEMFAKKGLMYSVINEAGKPIGLPIKSSAFYIKPTLRNLESKFDRNNEKRKVYKNDLRNRIDLVFRSLQGEGKSGFVNKAERNGITVLFRENEQGQLFGVTYVDHKNKSVFNGSDLGKAYSAKGLSEHLSARINQTPISRLKSALVSQPIKPNYLGKTYEVSDKNNLLQVNLNDHLSDEGIGIPKRKKRKKKQQQLTL